MSVETLEHRVTEARGEARPHPMLLLHGAWCGAWAYDPWVEPLANRGWEVHVMSLPGHGASSMSKGTINDYLLSDYVDAVDQIVQKIGRPPVVVGHSMGGLVARTYARSHGVPGLVLLAPVPHNVLGYVVRHLTQVPRPLLRAVVSRDNRITTLEQVDRFFLGPDSDFGTANMLQLLGPESARVVDQLLVARWRDTPMDTPTAIFTGGADTIFTPSEEGVLAERLQCTLRVYARQGHMITVEPKGQQVLADMDEWLRARVV